MTKAKWFVGIEARGAAFVALAIAASVWTGRGRADAPSGRYMMTTGTIAGGTALDTETGLTWQRTVPAASYAWADATSYCAALGTGWRLPSIKELQTIVDWERAAPAIDPTAFPDTPSAWSWSSSPVAGAAPDAWAVDFGDGSAYGGDETTANRVRCVR